MNWYKQAQYNIFIPAVLSLMQQPPGDMLELPSRLGLSSAVPMPEEANQIGAAINQVNLAMQLTPAQMDTLEMIQEFLGQTNQDPLDRILDNATIT